MVGVADPEALWPDLRFADREHAPEWFDPETGEHRPPPAVIELFVPDPDSGELPELTARCEDAARASRHDERARTVRWPIPRVVLDDEFFAMLAEQIDPLAADVADGLTVTESPRGWHQRLTPDAAAARDEIGRRLTELLADWPILEIHEIDDADHRLLVQLVDADLPDKDLPAVVDKVRERITPRRAGNRVVIDGGMEYVTELRDAARARVRDRLQIVAGLMSADRSERDELLRRIAAWDGGGDSYRSLAKLVGLSHPTVRNIVMEATVEHDLALDHLPATLRSLALAWDPPGLPEAHSDRYDDDYAPDDDDEFGIGESRRLEHLRLKSCAVCGEPPQKIVRRWTIGGSETLDRNDPHNEQPGYSRTLGQKPHYNTAARWAVCGTVCAREAINTDRARPTRRGGTDEYYEVERLHYTPHDSELPEPLLHLRSLLRALDQNWNWLAEATTTDDTEQAARSVNGFRRAIARIAEAVAHFRTYTPPPRQFLPGDPEPTNVERIRHGDDIYTNNNDPWAFGPRGWHIPGTDTALTWDELVSMADGDLYEIPVERLDFTSLTATHD
ncbi:hypothetical protein [Nocardia fusca]|uniref:hypothetical protein n=1 Tax=Nocardia fusca TaxID=941183 RepID=UPI0007A74E74|nr:hypothetical protein [Nocardia fusca]